MSGEEKVIEAQFQAEIMLCIGSLDYVRCWRQNAGGVTFERRGKVQRFRSGVPNGAADISGIVRPDGRRLEVEVKGPHGRLTKEQEAWGEFITSCGGIYLPAKYKPQHTMNENVDRVKYALDVEIARLRGTLVPSVSGAASPTGGSK